MPMDSKLDDSPSDGKWLRASMESSGNTRGITATLLPLEYLFQFLFEDPHIIILGDTVLGNQFHRKLTIFTT